jgi:hypothetical protein
MPGFLLAASLAWSVEGFAGESAADLATASITVAKSTIAADIAEYSRKLEEYTVLAPDQHGGQICARSQLFGWCWSVSLRAPREGDFWIFKIGFAPGGG